VCVCVCVCVCDSSGGGLRVEAHLSQIQNVRVLPLLSISMTKGTGIVTSVPRYDNDSRSLLP